MLIFDEKKYAERILESHKYKTSKSHGRERCVLTRYFSFLGYDNEKIKKELSKLSKNDFSGLDNKKIDFILDKIISKANDYEFVKDLEVKIFKTEIDIINSIENKNERNLLFISLVYYKWASQISRLRFNSKKIGRYMIRENDKDIWKLSGVSNLKTTERKLLCHDLLKKGLYKIENFKEYNYYYIPFSVDCGNVAINITKYENVLGELLYYNDSEHYKRCEHCDRVIKKNNNKIKYCNECAIREKYKKVNELKKNKRNGIK